MRRQESASPVASGRRVIRRWDVRYMGTQNIRAHLFGLFKGVRCHAQRASAASPPNHASHRWASEPITPHSEDLGCQRLLRVHTTDCLRVFPASTLPTARRCKVACSECPIIRTCDHLIHVEGVDALSRRGSQKQGTLVCICSARTKATHVPCACACPISS